MLSGTETLRCAIALSLMKGINRPAVEHLLHRCGDLTALFGETPENWRKILGITAPLFDAEARQKALAAADAEMRFIDKEGITPLFFTDSDYPARLLECPDAPLMLYFKGCGSLNPPRAISIVGTRRATRYGRDFCAALLRDLTESVPDLTIVSGMAYGIDICAHREALKNGLSTIGVLAHGLHTLYPAVHRDTAREALGNGGLLTEYTTGQKILKANFVTRNRIVAGMTDATLVVESPAKGGALITAHLARDYNRDVFALPGNVGQECSEGCNRLIRDNIAALITSADDLLAALRWEPAVRKEKAEQPSLFPDVTEQEARLLQLLRDEGEMQINRLTVAADMPASETLATLLELEFKGLVQSLPGGLYRTVR